VHRLLGSTSLARFFFLQVAGDRSTDFWTEVVDRSQARLGETTSTASPTTLTVSDGACTCTQFLNCTSRTVQLHLLAAVIFSSTFNIPIIGIVLCNLRSCNRLTRYLVSTISPYFFYTFSDACLENNREIINNLLLLSYAVYQSWTPS